MEQTIPLRSRDRAPDTGAAARRIVAAWLFACCALVSCIVVVGGITRLTHSGLSIVEWEPILGTLPPLSQADWGEVFGEYQQTPEYRQVNPGMSLREFKRIFWWEYVHRLLGRVIGLAFLVPALWFLWRGKISRTLVPRLLGIFALGALQGAVGWWMVKSGLIDDPRVSHVRLSIHLGLAFLIFAAMFWTALDLLAPREQKVADSQQRRLASYAIGLCALIFVMVLSGALVAGTRAGLAYNTFPLMNGQLLPAEYFMLQPWWENLLHNMAAVQFNHRLIAVLLLVAIPVWWWQATWKVGMAARARLAANLLLGMLGFQLALGIGTLVLRVPLALAVGHQAGALVLFALALWCAHAARRT